MIPYFCFDKIIIGPVTIYVWGIFIALAFLFGYLFLLKESKKAKIDMGIIHNLAIWVILGAVVGARLGYVLQFPRDFFSQPLEILKIWQGGLTLFGGIFGALVVGILYFILTKRRELFFPIADLVALALPLSFAIGRIGCSLINDHQGAETSLPWGIVWPDGVIRHPVAGYLIINALVLFLVLRFLLRTELVLVRGLKSRLKKPGQLFFFFLFLYSFSRFFLDFTRSIDTPLSDPHYFSLSTTQWLSLFIIFSIIIVGIRYSFKRSRT